jgi:A/G-specific adenine glycosylase
MPRIAPPSTATIAALRRDLLRWYRAHCRDLPWRRDEPIAYHVLVSEAMLQQTQVATVVDYFHRFIAALPTVRSLAAADEQVVLRLWQGLGYYRRARHLHAAAKAIVSEHAGVVPREVDALLALPGVGRYTAGAIASIAYGVPVPILDGNVARVLARWFAIEASIDDNAVRSELWSLAAAMVPRDDAGDFNQAMMELGALVCVPRGPVCLTCAVRDHCRAAAEGLAEKLPIRNLRRAPKAVQHQVIAVERGGKWLFEQRPDKGLWSAMWQMPTVENAATVDEISLLAWLHERFGLDCDALVRVERFTHQTTHRTIDFNVWRTRVAGGRLKRGSGVWRGLDALDDLPLPNPQRRAVKVLQSDTTAE